MMEEFKVKDISGPPPRSRSAEANNKTRPEGVANELKLAEEILRLMRAL